MQFTPSGHSNSADLIAPEARIRMTTFIRIPRKFSLNKRRPLERTRITSFVGKARA